MLSRRPSATPAQVRKALNASAIDILTNGIDRASGRGIIMATGAVNAITNAVTMNEATVDANGELEPDGASLQALREFAQPVSELSQP